MSIYKSYDIRGVWGRDWDAAVARAIGRALPGVMEAREICVGRDARLSSDELFDAFAGGVRRPAPGSPTSAGATRPRSTSPRPGTGSTRG